MAKFVGVRVLMVTMLRFSDQYYNEKLITEMHEFGVEMGATKWSILSYKGKKKTLT